MQSVTKKDIEKIENDPLSFAMMMENHQLENVIVAFISVLLKRIEDRGGKN